MNKSNNIKILKNNHITTIIINRPEKRNSLTPSLLKELTNLLKKIETDDSVKCLVIRGAGEKAFSSGFDISSIGQNDMLRDYDKDDPLVNAMKSIEEFPFPVIAMINGHAFGAGLELAASCDMRICVENAKMGMPPAKLGVVYTYSGIRKFINIVGLSKTKEIFLVGDTIDAIEAKELGLINHVVANSALEKFTYSIAAKITENAPLSLMTMKKMINSWQNNQSVTADDEITIKKMLQKVQESEDYREGRKAFEEKRKPVFKGK